MYQFSDTDTCILPEGVLVERLSTNEDPSSFQFIYMICTCPIWSYKCVEWGLLVSYTFALGLCPVIHTPSRECVVV